MSLNGLGWGGLRWLVPIWGLLAPPIAAQSAPPSGEIDAQVIWTDTLPARFFSAGCAGQRMGLVRGGYTIHPDTERPMDAFLVGAERPVRRIRIEGDWRSPIAVRIGPGDSLRVFWGVPLDASDTESHPWIIRTGVVDEGVATPDAQEILEDREWMAWGLTSSVSGGPADVVEVAVVSTRLGSSSLHLLRLRQGVVVARASVPLRIGFQVQSVLGSPGEWALTAIKEPDDPPGFRIHHVTWREGMLEPEFRTVVSQVQGQVIMGMSAVRCGGRSLIVTEEGGLSRLSIIGSPDEEIRTLPVPEAVLGKFYPRCMSDGRIRLFRAALLRGGTGEAEIFDQTPDGSWERVFSRPMRGWGQFLAATDGLSALLIDWDEAAGRSELSLLRFGEPDARN